MNEWRKGNFYKIRIIITLKSMYPFLSMSNVLKTWSQNSSAFPDGKNILYMSTNFAGVNRPLGQSCCKRKLNKISFIIKKQCRNQAGETEPKNGPQNISVAVTYDESSLSIHMDNLLSSRAFRVMKQRMSG